MESKWNRPFWIVPAEDFREKQNIRKVSPAFPDGMFQTEIRVDTSFKYIFRFRFSVNGTDLSRFVQMVKAIPGRNLTFLIAVCPNRDRFANVNGRKNFEKYMIFHTPVCCTVRDSRIRSEMS